MNIIITGSTSGLGLAFAIKFLELGDKVVISSKTPEKVNKVTDLLQKRFSKLNVVGVVCDVSNPSDVTNLGQTAIQFFQTVDFWINNAGTTYAHGVALVDNSDEMLREIIDTNLLGTLYGCREALKIMIPQKSGNIINIAGKGTEGSASENLIAYASSKRALDVLHKSLVKETKMTNVGIHLISPGMVLTNLLLKDNTSIRTKKVFNILSEHPTTVANKLVPKIRKFRGSGKKITLLDRKKALLRFMTAFRYKNKFFNTTGDLIVSIDPLESQNN